MPLELPGEADEVFVVTEKSSGATSSMTSRFLTTMRGAVKRAGFCFALCLYGNAAEARPFTVADEVELADFGDISYSTKIEAITRSPDGRWVAVYAARGLLRENRVQSIVRVYALADLVKYVNSPTEKDPPPPRWSIQEAVQEGLAISDVRWTADSGSITFLQKQDDGRRQLVLRELKRGTRAPLSLEGQDVTAYDVRDRARYAYASRDPAVWHRPGVERKMPAVVGTGRAFADFFFPADLFPKAVDTDRSELWVASGAAPVKLKDSTTGEPIAIYYAGQREFAISPDGSHLATALPIENVPTEWTSRFAMPRADWHLPMLAGMQDTKSLYGSRYLSRYAVIGLQSGTVWFPADVPTGSLNGWATTARPTWSSSGREVVLPTLFLSEPDSDGKVRPCIAIADIRGGTVQCLEKLKSRFSQPGSEGGFSDFKNSQVRGDGKVVLESGVDGGAVMYRTYFRNRLGWSLESVEPQAAGRPPLGVEVRQSLNEPPVLVATNANTKTARIVWDPNPQLEDFAFGVTTVYRWTDASGRQRTGGLYKPTNYLRGTRYPLVIQPHGFDEQVYRPSGRYTTALAARAMAAAGIVVLQMQDCDPTVDSQEGECQVAAYEGAVKQLSASGLIDADRIGIVGFSRTCYYVLEAMTKGQLGIAAASITDGVNEGYWQYLLTADYGGNSIAHEANLMMGAAPFGPGLSRWLESSPTFNMDKVTAPLQVVANGPKSLLFMWEPYATLRYLKKPVDLILLNTDEHVLTTPAVRMASQGGTVDWMSFWLQGYEDPSSEKSEQYRRWENLCDLQKTQNPHHPTFCVRTTH